MSTELSTTQAVSEQPATPVDVAAIKAQQREDAVLYSYVLTALCFVLVLVLSFKRFANAKAKVRQRVQREQAKARSSGAAPE